MLVVLADHVQSDRKMGVLDDLLSHDE
jgi:hypothetical protein